MKSRVAAKKETPTQKHRDERVTFVLKYLEKDVDFWNRVYFADEKGFSLSEDCRRLVWKPKEISRLDPRYIIPKNHSGRINAAFMGCMSA